MADKLPASLSIDLDNRWSYMKTHGDPGWQGFPSYLDQVVPRILERLRQRELTATFFIVGQDAALERNRDALAAIAADGHEIGNHSFNHEPWLHLYSPDQIDRELARTEEAIEQATGRRPKGFRGPGFSLSADVLRCLARRGYAYDATTLPSYLGPLARAYYFMTARMSREERACRDQLFGSWREGLRPVKPYWWKLDGQLLLELPVSTMPVLKLPFHLSYPLYLARHSAAAAAAYFRLALALCRATGTQPSLLLHSLDFLGSDDGVGLDFFPAMDRPAAWKLAQVERYLDGYARAFSVTTVGAHAAAIAAAGGLPAYEPHFAAAARADAHATAATPVWRKGGPG